jgi:hypothetical protein
MVPARFTAEVTEVMVNGPDDVYVERKGRVRHQDVDQDQYDRWSTSPIEAWKWLERHDPGFAPTPTEPLQVVVTHAPPVEGDSA